MQTTVDMMLKFRERLAAYRKWLAARVPSRRGPYSGRAVLLLAGPTTVLVAGWWLVWEGIGHVNEGTQRDAAHYFYGAVIGVYTGVVAAFFVTWTFAEAIRWLLSRTWLRPDELGESRWARAWERDAPRYRSMLIGVAERLVVMAVTIALLYAGQAVAMGALASVYFALKSVRRVATAPRGEVTQATVNSIWGSALSIGVAVFAGWLFVTTAWPD